MTITQDWENICEQAAMACNAQASSLFLVDRTDKSRLIQVSGSGYARGRIAEYELPDTIDSRSCPGLTPWVVKSGNVLNVKSYEELIRHPAYSGKQRGQSLKCEISLPISFISRPS